MFHQYLAKKVLSGEKIDIRSAFLAVIIVVSPILIMLFLLNYFSG